MPAGVWKLGAAAADGARGSARVQVIREGARVEVEIRCSSRAETLDGRVLFEDGRPFTGVVLVTPHPSMRFDEVSLPEASGTRLVLDGEGRFHAVALPRGKVAVGALTVGSLRVNGMVVSVPYEGEYVLRVPLPGSVVGRVVSDTDGSGIAGAEVLGTGMTGNALALVYGRTVTDAGGAFSLALPASGRLSARADGYAGVTRPYADSKLEIRLLRPARLEGRVTSSAPGTGVAGVEVRLRPPRDREVAFPPEPALTDADGRYALEGLEPGETFVLASGPGWMTRGAAETRLDGFNPFLVRLEPGKTATLDLVVETGAAIAGRVLDPDGRPVGGALVRARRLTMDFDSVLGRFESWGEPTAANADGVFRLDSLAPGATYRVSAGAPGFASAFVDATAPEGEAVPPIELHLGVAHALVVTVLDDEHGVPIPGASVICELSRGDLTTTDEWVTGSDGRASIYPVGAVGVHVNASADGFRRSGRLDVPASRAEAVVRLTPGLDIVGRVLSSDGTPAAGVRVRCTPPESEVTTGADGTFRVRGLGEGPHELRATASYPQPLTAATTVDAGRTDVILTLAASAKDEPSRTLIVRVLDAQGVRSRAPTSSFPGVRPRETRHPRPVGRSSMAPRGSRISRIAARGRSGCPKPARGTGSRWPWGPPRSSTSPPPLRRSSSASRRSARSRDACSDRTASGSPACPSMR